MLGGVIGSPPMKLEDIAVRAPGPVYAHVLEFLKRSHGQKLREVIDAEID